MRRAVTLFALLCWAGHAAAACHEIPGVSPPLGIVLPEGWTAAFKVAGGFVVEPSGATRYPHYMTIRASVPEAGDLSATQHDASLNGDFRILYNTRTVEQDGIDATGGYLGGLVIAKDGGEPVASVACVTQRKRGVNPEWCLEHLQMLKSGGCPP